MATHLFRVMEAIGDRLVATYAARGHDLLFLGPERQDETTTPRVVWNPSTASHLPPRRLGGGPRDDGPILTRRWLIAVNLWGGSLDSTVELADAFLASAHDLLSQFSYGMPLEEWTTAAAVGKGALCAMVFPFLAPVLRTAMPTRPVTGITPTYEMGNTEV